MSDYIDYKLPIGTKVRMTQQAAGYWGTDPDFNPVGAVGVTTEFVDEEMSNSYGFINRVQWPGGFKNAYMAGDLEIVKEGE